MPCPLAGRNQAPASKQPCTDGRTSGIWSLLIIPLSLVLLVSVLRLLLRPMIGDSAPLLPFIGAVVISASRGGLRGGAIATFLSIFAINILELQLGNVERILEANLARDGLFLAAGLLLSLLTDRLLQEHHQVAALAKALQENELRRRAILDSAVSGVIVINEDGLIESINTAAEKTSATGRMS